METLRDFIKYELKPAIFNNVSLLFPEMEFKRAGNNRWISPKKIGGLDPHEPRRDKSVITNKYPDRILEQGGDSIEVIDYYVKHRGVSSSIEAIRAISNTLGLVVPSGDSATYIAYKEKQDKIHNLLRIMQDELYKPSGEYTLAYARSRGWDDEVIKGMGLGYCSPEMANKLKEINKDGTYFPSTIGNTHTLAIPYYSGGSILGLVFRKIGVDDGTKYTEIFFSKDGTKKYHLFNLTGLPIIKGGKDDKTIIVVEGEIDALRAKVAGVDNVVAAAGNNLSIEALEEAKKMGVEYVILLLDNDGKAKLKNNVDSIKGALSRIRAVGLQDLVAHFPFDPEDENKKVDTDSYLLTHTGEELKELIGKARLGVDYQVASLCDILNNGNISGIEEDKLRKELVNLAFCSNLNRLDQERLFTLIENESGKRVTKAYLMESLLKIEEARAKEEQSSRATELFSEINSLMISGRIEEALSVMEKGKRILSLTKEGEYSKYLEAPSRDTLLAGLQSKKEGIPTGYYFSGKDRKLIEWEIPTGALTFICAPTSHGKSRYLQNLALNLAYNNREGSIVYISLEEDTPQIIERLINIRINEDLNNSGRNNIQMIRDYFRDGENKRYIKGEKLPKIEKGKEDIFSLLESQRIKIFSRSDNPEIGYIEDLQDIIEYLIKNIPLQAIIIDYVQEIYSRNGTSNRKGELMEVCNKLMSLSVSTGLPIILAAQLNREALSPLDMGVQNIADASNIEHSANTIILLWDSIVEPQAGKDNSYYFYSRVGSGADQKKERRLTEEANKLAGKGFILGEKGKLYALMAKNRSGERNIEAIFSYNGNTGKVYQQLQEIELNKPEDKKPSLYIGR